MLAYAWAEPARPALLLGVGVAATTLVTVTWRDWSATRRAWAEVRARQAVRDARLARLTDEAASLRRAVDAARARLDAARRASTELPVGLGAERGALLRGAARLERAVLRARALLEVPLEQDPASDAAHEAWCDAHGAALERARTQLRELDEALVAAVAALEAAARRVTQALAASLGELERAVDGLAVAEAEARTARRGAHVAVDELLTEAMAVRTAADALCHEVAETTDDDLRARIGAARQLAAAADQLGEALRDTLPGLVAAAPAGEGVHCPVCGTAHADGGRFCVACGAARPAALGCGACGRVTHLPHHLLRDGWADQDVHCGGCGAELRPAA
ncbi:MAG: zinc ribbon domain-containing protein [Myxococcota bacterium]